MLSTPAQLSMIRQAMTAAAGTWPKIVAKALADTEKLPAAAAAIPAPTPDALAAAVVDCLTAGRDPLDDEQVRRLTTAATLAGNNIVAGVARAAEDRVAAALTEAADDMLAIFGEAVAADGATLTAAWRILADLDLNDSAAILRMGPDASRAWTDALDAQKRVRTISGGWWALAEMTRFASSSEAPVLRLASLSLDQYEMLGRKAEPWDIVRAGATLELADRRSIPARLARLASDRQARQAESETAFAAGYRSHHGVPA